MATKVKKGKALVDILRSDTAILEDIRRVETGLSPENLARDGEATKKQIGQAKAKLLATRKKLVVELGREPTAEELLPPPPAERQAKPSKAVKGPDAPVAVPEAADPIQTPPPAPTPPAGDWNEADAIKPSPEFIQTCDEVREEMRASKGKVKPTPKSRPKGRVVVINEKGLTTGAWNKANRPSWWVQIRVGKDTVRDLEHVKVPGNKPLQIEVDCDYEKIGADILIAWGIGAGPKAERGSAISPEVPEPPKPTTPAPKAEVGAPGTTIGAERKKGESVADFILRMTQKYGYHPRTIAACPAILRDAKIDPALLTKEDLVFLTKKSWEKFQEWEQFQDNRGSVGGERAWLVYGIVDRSVQVSQPEANGKPASAEAKPKAPRTASTGSDKPRGGSVGDRAMAVLSTVPMGMKDIVTKAGLTDTCYNALNKLVAKGLLEKRDGGYALPGK